MSDDLTDELGANIPLSEMLQTLRTELQVAMRAGEGQPVRFDVGPDDLELQIRVGRSGGGGGKVTFWVLQASGSGSASHEAVHTFRLRLTPHLEGEAPPLSVSDRTSDRPL